MDAESIEYAVVKKEIDEYLQDLKADKEGLEERLKRELEELSKR